MVQRHQIHENVTDQMRQGIDDSRLQKITFSPNSADFKKIHWHDKGEFRYNGTMYDVVKTVKHGAKITYYCLRDNDETSLFAQLEDLFKKENKQAPLDQKNKELTSMLSPYYLGSIMHAPIPFYQMALHSKSLYSFNVKTWSQPPVAPPPQELS